MEQQQNRNVNIDPNVVIEYLRNEVANKVNELAMLNAHNIALQRELAQAQEAIDALVEDKKANHKDSAQVPTTGDNDQVLRQVPDAGQETQS